MNERRFHTFWANFVIASVLITVFAVAYVAARPHEEGYEAVNKAIYSGADEGCVSLMFNVYEHPENAERIAETLKSYGFNATFFIGGSFAARHRDTVLKLGAEGFEIGNHGYLHKDHAKLGVQDNIKEIAVTERLLDNILSPLPGYENCKLFAPPSGSMGENMFDACDKLGYRVIMWTRDTVDWRDRDEDVIFERAVRDVKGGDFILMHPTDCTLAALPRILDAISAAGLRADTVSHVLDGHAVEDTASIRFV